MNGAPPVAIKLSGPVGAGGRNHRNDVKIVQQLLNKAGSAGKHGKLTVDGIIGPKTQAAIVEFQKKTCGYGSPDGKIDSNGKTFSLLKVGAIVAAVQRDGVIRMEIVRKTSQVNCVLGELSINGEFLCYTLELPWNWNRTGASCIPFGEYTGSIRTDGSRGWRIQLGGVPGRTVIQIHIGNYPRQIEGCILVGDKTGPGAVYNSGDTLKTLRLVYEHVRRPSIRVRVTGAMNLPPELVPGGRMGQRARVTV